MNDLANVVGLDAIRRRRVRLGVDPLGGASVAYWDAIRDRYRINSRLLAPPRGGRVRDVGIDIDLKMRAWSRNREPESEDDGGVDQAALSFVRAPFLRFGRASCTGNGRPLSAGPGRALISRASTFDLQVGQISSGLIEWPQGLWTNSTGTPARPAIQRSPHAVIVAING